MKDEHIHNISEEELRNNSFADNAMNEAFNFDAPPMPIFAEFNSRIQYLADDALDDLMAAGQAALLEAKDIDLPKL